MQMPRDTLADVSDETLLVLCANGATEVSRRLTVRLVPRILGYALRILSNRAEAEDVRQETMLRLWQVAQRFRRPCVPIP